MSDTRINSQLTTRRSGASRQHKLSRCAGTGLPRYRDRHQARDAAHNITIAAKRFKAHTYPCIDCGGFHIEQSPVLPTAPDDTPPTGGADRSLSTIKSTRRYVLVDIENLTQGAQASSAEASALWEALHSTLLDITDADHVVVGAALKVHRKYRTSLRGPSTKWVVGSSGADGADRALLAAIDLTRVARDYDELVIASGDHAFAELANRASRLGMLVHVVHAEHPGQRTTLARQLSGAAQIRSVIRDDLQVTTVSKRVGSLVTDPIARRPLRGVHSTGAHQRHLDRQAVAA